MDEARAAVTNSMRKECSDFTTIAKGVTRNMEKSAETEWDENKLLQDGVSGNEEASREHRRAGT